MKKSKQVFLILLLLHTGFLLQSQEISVGSVRNQGEIFLLDCRILLADTGRLLSSLDEGNTVTIGIRLRDGSSESSFFNLRAGYYTYQRRLSWDPIEGLYVIEEPGGLRRFFPHKDALLEAALTYRDLPVTVPGGRHSFRLRGEIQWKRLIPPLNLLTPFLPDLRSMTPWREIDLFRQKGRAGASGE